MQVLCRYCFIELLKVEAELLHLQKNNDSPQALFVSSKIVISHLEEEIQRAWVYKMPLAAIILKIEGWLDANSNNHRDTFLHKLAEEIQILTKDAELCCLMSDEEVLIITPGLNAMQAQKQAELLIEDISSYNLTHGIDVRLSYKNVEYEQEDSAQQFMNKLQR